MKNPRTQLRGAWPGHASPQRYVQARDRHPEIGPPAGSIPCQPRSSRHAVVVQFGTLKSLFYHLALPLSRPFHASAGIPILQRWIHNWSSTSVEDHHGDGPSPKTTQHLGANCRGGRPRGGRRRRQQQCSMWRWRWRWRWFAKRADRAWPAIIGDLLHHDDRRHRARGLREGPAFVSGLLEDDLDGDGGYPEGQNLFLLLERDGLDPRRKSDGHSPGRTAVGYPFHPGRCG